MEVEMKPIHMRDSRFPRQALHYHWASFEESHLTDNLEKVTCKTCLKMMERAKKHQAKLEE